MRTLVAIALVASVVPGVVAPGVAAAAGPSIGLPDIKPVPVAQQTTSTRPVDPATSNAMSGPQQPRTDKPGSGENSATSLSPTSTWEVSAQSGDFAWSYPLRVPPAPGGFEPDLALSYRSSSVDGRTSVTNNQPSWVGDGWDLSVGFVERTYGGCISDTGGGTTPPKVGDLCWRSDNATAAYGDSGGMLIRNGNGDWRAKNDDGARIEQLTGAGNGDNNGEHWRITTVDGTQYLFGSQADSKSTWTVPVFGDDAGEPCHGTTFEASHCVQAYRWNLDKVIDPHGNVIRYFYDTESNNYGMNVKDNAVSYIRSGSLRRIDYGLNDNVAGPATGQIEFTTADRCVPGAACNLATKASWPDTPLDSRCDTATCKDKYIPTFWTTKRLDSVTTRVRNGSGYRDVDRWNLAQTYPDPGDGEKPALWLKSIVHTGLAGTPIALPPITFEGAQMPNRVSRLSDGYAPLNRYRLTGIVSESGGVTSINYAPAECSPTNLPSAAEHNAKKCFPVRWAPPNHEERLDYFHKYVVEKVILSDQLSSSTQQVTSYEYLDGAGWHFDTSEFGKEDKKTWSEFRGFGRVRIRGGSSDDQAGPVTMSEERFYRGMHGDKLPNNGTRTANVSDSDGGVRADEDWLQGFPYESITFNGEAPSTAPAPAVVSKNITDPVWRGPTATRDAFKAYQVRPGTERGFTALAAGGWRKTKTTTTYDDRGLPTVVDDRGDLATAEDDQCTRTTYVRNTDKWLLNLPAEQETVSVNCDTAPRFPDHAVSGERSSYDGKAAGTAPTTGKLTKTEVADSRPAAGANYATTAAASYDAYGRMTQYNDAMGKPAKVSFSPATGPTTTTTVTSAPTPTVPQGLVTTTTVDSAYGQPTMVVDPNGRVTEHTYDALGRKTATWLPNRWSEEESASFKYSYTIRKDGPTVVTTSKLGPNGIYVNSNTLYDGLMRQRQVQQPAPGGGRVITDTRYDSQGRAFKTTQPYFNNATMDGNLWVASDTQVPGLTRTTFDGAGREIEATYQAGAIDQWKATTTYFGDRVSTTPPTGGTTTTTTINALGKPTEFRQHVGVQATSGFDATKYKYTSDGKLAEVTGPDGKVWRSKYDLRGRKVLVEDPDRGTTTMTYDNAGRLKTTRDARGTTLAYDYDSLGRKTAVHNDSLSGTKLTEWTYDTATFGKGLLASATRFVDDKAYKGSIDSYTALNKPLSTSVTIPSVEGLLAGTYTSFLGYGADGSLTGESYPAVGGLAEETVNYSLDDLGRAKSTKTAAGVVLAASTQYTRYGEIERLELGSGSKRAWHSLYYDTSSRRLIRSIVDAEVPKPMQTDINYGYDLAGNITSITDKPLGQEPDIQCFRQDHLQRMTEAWTPTAAAGCAQGPKSEPGALSGPAPYWNSYTYDKGGNRLTETQRTPSTSVPRSYTYPADQPHTVDKITGPAGADTFDYDPAGNTISRVKAGAGETLSWDTEGHLASLTKNGQVTSFIYSAEGERLMRKDSAGATLYIGKQELWLPAAGGASSATRYYTHGENVVAVRHNRSLTWLFGDHQGTAQVAVSAETLSVAKRRQDPFGATRGSTAAWPGERGFVGGTQDSSTGLTHLGAREYDPATGRFISIDPLVNMADPQQMQGYSYSSSNPANLSDPDGLCAGPDGIGCRHKVSKEGFGDMRDPANKARYEASRDNWIRNHKARNQVILRNGDVRCPDGEKFCKAVSGAPSKSEVEAQQRRERREREEKQRKLEQSFNKVIPKEARGWFGVTNLIDFESGSVCVEAKVGALFHGHTWGCVNWDMKGITFSSGVKIGVELGGGAHVVGMLRLNKGAMADKLDKGVFASADVGFRGGVLLTTGVNAVVEATTQGKIHGAVEVRFGAGAELSFASASVGFGANSGYIEW